MTPAEESVIFYYELGLAITQWAHVEDALLNIFGACHIGHYHRGTLSTTFYSIENFRSKLQVVDNVFCLKFRDTPHFAVWIDLFEKLRSASAERNWLAHYTALVYPTAKAGRRFGLLPKLAKSRGKPSKRPQKTTPGSLR
jgi:hypothetical protein